MPQVDSTEAVARPDSIHEIRCQFPFLDIIGFWRPRRHAPTSFAFVVDNVLRQNLQSAPLESFPTKILQKRTDTTSNHDAIVEIVLSVETGDVFPIGISTVIIGGVDQVPN
jgi:hypothetical protein